MPYLTVEFSGLQIIEFDKKALRKVLSAAGSEIASLAKRNIRRAAGGGRTYYNSGGNKYHPYKTGKYTASAPGSAPVDVTGDLIKSIRSSAFRKGDGVEIRDYAFYSAALEYGAQGGGRRGRKGQQGTRDRKRNTVTSRILKPRPFLLPALDERRSSIEARIAKAIEQGIDFRKEKVSRR
jgi:hypothetical protein